MPAEHHARITFGGLESLGHPWLLQAFLDSPSDRAEPAALQGLLPTLALLIEARDPHTKGHCERLADYSVALGDAIGLGRDDVEALRQGGVLHDIGKIGIPDAVLLKPGRLTDDEYALMKRHPLIGKIVEHGLRELVISRGRTGYVALYSFEETQETVLVLAIRHQREAGYWNSGETDEA